MENLNLTPDLHLLSAEQEVVLPPPVSASDTAQPIGGFMASPGALTNGNITLNGAGEQILVGAATAPGAGIGVFIGNAGDGTYDFRAGDPAGHYIWWDASTNTLTVNGDVAVSSLNIPDTTTASSFHVDSSGNTWWGANVAGGLAAAKASITAAGAAVFKNAQIGGTNTQYTIGDSGMFSFGDGSDGAAVCDGSTAVAGMTRSSSTYTMTRDVYFTTLVINSGVTVKPSGYRIFCNISLTVNGTISRDGNTGGPGGNAVSGGSVGAGGTAGAALPDGYLKGSMAGQAGSNGSSGNGTDGIAGGSTTNSLGSNGTAGGNTNDAGGTHVGGVGGTATPSNVKLIANWHLTTLLDISSSGSTVKFDNSAGAGSGAGGGVTTGGASRGGGGGGSGSAGGILAIYARAIIIGASGIISAIGGNGGKGGDGAGAAGVGGAGAAGGNGGIIVLVFNTLSNLGSITAAKGIGGAAGASLGGGNATAGNDGAAGTLYEFQLSL